MSRKHLWISATIIACVIFISFALSVPHTRDVSVEQSLAETANIPLVTLRDSFRKGVHTISGSFEAPNACAERTRADRKGLLLGHRKGKLC